MTKMKFASEKADSGRRMESGWLARVKSKRSWFRGDLFIQGRKKKKPHTTSTTTPGPEFTRPVRRM